MSPIEVHHSKSFLISLITVLAPITKWVLTYGQTQMQVIAAPHTEGNHGSHPIQGWESTEMAQEITIFLPRHRQTCKHAGPDQITTSLGSFDPWPVSHPHMHRDPHISLRLLQQRCPESQSRMYHHDGGPSFLQPRTPDPYS